MKKLLLLFVLLCTFQQSHTREVIDLNDNWWFQTPYQVWSEGMRLRWGKYINVDIPYDFSIAQPFDKDCITGTSGGYLPGGTGMYRKEDFLIKNEWKDKKIYLEFEGVYQNSEVYVNGIRQGKRPNGWISFGYDITRWVDLGVENVIAVKVDNSKHLNSRWYTGSGIFRPVRAIVTDKLHIAFNGGIFVYTPLVTKQSAKVKTESKIFNEYAEKKSFILKQEVLDAKRKIVAVTESVQSLNPSEENTFYHELDVNNPLLWDVDSPNLYVLKTTIISDNKVVDETETTFGIRTIEFTADKGFFLNGKNMKLKGVCIHHDGGMLGAAVPYGVMERRIKILKEMGCNAIRTSHNPFDNQFYELCDKYGMLVMDEIYDEWTVPTTSRVPYGGNTYWKEWHERDLHDFIVRDRNHPSVFMYSLGNELTEQFYPEGKDIAEKLVNITRSLDPTRPITAGNNAMPEANRTGMAQVFDVAGYNYGPQFDLYEKDREHYPDRKFIGTENTRGHSTRGYYSFPLPKDGLVKRTSEMYYSSYDGISRKYGMEHEWKVTRDLDYISGMFIWTAFDYIGETDYPWPSKYCNFGALDACGFPKDAFYFYQSQWHTSKDVLHLLPHWNWKGREDEVTPVWCYTNCDEVELFLNGKSQGRRRVSETEKLRIEWADVRYESGELKAIGYRNKMKVMEKVVRTTDEPYAFKIEADKVSLKNDNRDVAHLTISVVDKDGLSVPDANVEFNLKYTGDIKLLGIDNGDPLYVGNFKQTTERKLFNGLALAILQSSKRRGIVEIEISGENIKAAKLKMLIE